MPLAEGDTEGDELVWRIYDEDGNVLAGIDLVPDRFLASLTRADGPIYGALQLQRNQINIETLDPDSAKFGYIGTLADRVDLQVTDEDQVAHVVSLDKYGFHPMNPAGGFIGAAMPALFGGTEDPSTGYGANAQQYIGLNGDPGPLTGGTLTLDFDGDAIVITWDDDATELQADFDAALGAGNTLLDGRTLVDDGFFFVEFTGTLAESPQPLITITDDSLVGDTATVTDFSPGRTPGVAAACGSTFQRNVDDITGELWWKSGPGDTDWTKLTP